MITKTPSYTVTHSNTIPSTAAKSTVDNVDSPQIKLCRGNKRKRRLMDKILIHASQNLNNIMLSERHKSQQTTYNMILFIRHVQKD